jgi:hypothetical protein
MSQKATLTLEDGTDVSFDTTITIQDNFLDKDYFQYLKSLVFSPEFTWNMSVIIGPLPENNSFIKNDHQPEDDLQFTHVAYADHNILSDFYNRLGPMFRDMQLYNCMKIKINMLPRQEKIIEHGMHVDYPEAPLGNLTSVFYFNTNNGYTKFATGEKVESVENRLVTFPVHIPHTGSTNTCDARGRCVMNINWSKALGTPDSITNKAREKWQENYKNQKTIDINSSIQGERHGRF